MLTKGGLVSPPSPFAPYIIGKFGSAHKYCVAEGFVMYLTNTVQPRIGATHTQAGARVGCCRKGQEGTRAREPHKGIPKSWGELYVPKGHGSDGSTQL